MIKPIKKNVLFKPLEGDSQTTGGIIVPDSFKQESNKGVVVEVGCMVTKVKKGEHAFRVKGWGQPIDIDGCRYYIFDENAIIAKA